jgi:RNA polymerase sigma factor (sigma-70 family)
MNLTQSRQIISDAALISAYLEGQPKALELLINKHKDRIYTTIYMIVKDKYLAEDIFQDTFLKLIKTIDEGNYCDQGKFLPWASRIAHNLCMDYYRKVKRNVPITNAEGEDILEFLCKDDSFTCNNSTIESKQKNQSIHHIIQQLPRDQSEVVVMRIYGEMSFKDIAAATGVSINTALGRMRYGLINLRRMIEEKGINVR